MKQLFKRKVAVIGTSNEIHEPAEVLRIPFGQYKHSHGIQVLGAGEAKAIVSTFNERQKPLPFYIGHPDEKGLFVKYSDHRAYGWIIDITANENEVELAVEWTEDGRDMLEKGMFRWWSPRFLNVKRISTTNEKQLHPFCITSAGLTHTPNMDLEPAANEDEELLEEINNQETQNKGVDMNELLQRLLALIGKDDVKTDDDVVSYVQKLIDGAKAIKKAMEERWKAEDAAYLATENEAAADTLAGLLSVPDGKHNNAIETSANEVPEETKSELSELKEQVSTANEALAASQAAHAGLLLDGALADGRITPAQRAGYETRFASDFEATANELAAAPVVMKTVSDVEDAAERNTTARSIQDQIQYSVNEVMNDGLNYDQAFARVKKENPAWFDQPKKES